MIPLPTWTPTAAEYHADPRVSSTLLRTMLDSPGKALDIYLKRGSKPETRPMRLGSAIGARLQGQFDQLFTACDVAARSAKAWKEAQAAEPLRQVLTRPEMDLVSAVCVEIEEPKTHAAKLAQALLLKHPGYSEYAGVWDEVLEISDSGALDAVVPCRYMVDRLIWLQGRPWIVEIKSTAQPAPERFKWTIRDRRYGEQAALNVRGVERTIGMRPGFIWVVVGTEAPHEILVRQISEDRLAAADSEVDRGLWLLYEAMKNPARDVWSAPWEANFEGEIPSI